MPDATSWHAADEAYQAHHIGCPQCIAAGINRSSQVRCPAGQALWEAYSNADLPLSPGQRPVEAKFQKLSRPTSSRAFL